LLSCHCKAGPVDALHFAASHHQRYINAIPLSFFFLAERGLSTVCARGNTGTFDVVAMQLIWERPAHDGTEDHHLPTRYV
jgi:hypothetical protein